MFSSIGENLLELGKLLGAIYLALTAVYTLVLVFLILWERYDRFQERRRHDGESHNIGAS